MIVNKLYFLGGLILVLFGIAGAGFLYFKYTQNQIQRLAQEAQTYKLANEEQKLVINQMIEDQKLLASILENIKKEQDISKKELNDLENKFNKETYYGERDIGFVAENKPKLVENIINNATNQALRCMEQSTGKLIDEQNINCN